MSRSLASLGSRAKSQKLSLGSFFSAYVRSRPDRTYASASWNYVTMTGDTHSMGQDRHTAYWAWCHTTYARICSRSCPGMSVLVMWLTKCWPPPLSMIDSCQLIRFVTIKTLSARSQAKRKVKRGWVRRSTEYLIDQTSRVLPGEAWRR